MNKIKNVSGVICAIYDLSKSIFIDFILILFVCVRVVTGGWIGTASRGRPQPGVCVAVAGSYYLSSLACFLMCSASRLLNSLRTNNTTVSVACSCPLPHKSHQDKLSTETFIFAPANQICT
jgi:hypothetical protein